MFMAVGVVVLLIFCSVNIEVVVDILIHDEQEVVLLTLLTQEFPDHSCVLLLCPFLIYKFAGDRGLQLYLKSAV